MHRILTLVPAALVALAAVAPQALAQGARISPDSPAPGAVVEVIVETGTDSVVAVHGTLAGEQLHFAAGAEGRWSSLGPVPVDAADSVVAIVIVERATGSDTMFARAAVPPVEKVASSALSVAPQFSRPLDAETAARVARENAKARAVGTAAHETPRLWVSPFRRPRTSVITSQFGTGRVFNGELTSRHLGVDFRGATGEEVRAANRGVVALVDTFFLAGRLIYINHGAGITTAYFHLSRTLVAEGDTVVRGQLIGHVGGTGRVTAPHLHWAARYGTLNVNPLDLVARTEGDAPSKSLPASTPKP